MTSVSAMLAMGLDREKEHFNAIKMLVMSIKIYFKCLVCDTMLRKPTEGFLLPRNLVNQPL